MTLYSSMNHKIRNINLMNKIKIINAEIVRDLKNSRRQLFIDLSRSSSNHPVKPFSLDSQFYHDQSSSRKLRPLTPSDIIKKLYHRPLSSQNARTQNPSESYPIKRKERIKTSISGKIHSYVDNKTPQRKLSGIKSQDRSKMNNKYLHKQNKNKIDDSEMEVKAIRSKMMDVFKEITEENIQSKARLEKKMEKYRENKFEKFWKTHQIDKISAKTLTSLQQRPERLGKPIKNFD